MVVGSLCVLIGSIYVSTIIILYIARPLYSANFDYQGKHIVVTGGSSGIGLDGNNTTLYDITFKTCGAVAKEYLLRGGKVTIVARNQQRLDEAIAILRPLCTYSGQCVTAVSVDCSSDSGVVERALQPVMESVGDVDVIVNCAGTSIAAEFDETDPVEFERMLRINVLGSIYPTRAVLRCMKKNKRGRIVFVSSQVIRICRAYCS